MSSNILPTIVGVLTGTGVLSTVALCFRQFLRYRAECERWRSIERLTDKLGLAALKVLPDLARELRDPGPVDAVRRGPPRRRRPTATRRSRDAPPEAE